MSICKCNHSRINGGRHQINLSIANEKNLKKIIITFAILAYLALLYLISGIVILRRARKYLRIICI
jgi:hypothetical protein